MLKPIMDDQNSSNLPQRDIQNTGAQGPPAVTPQPAQPIEQTVSPTTVNLPVAPPVSTEAVQPSSQLNTEPTSVTSEWPGAFKVYKISKAAVTPNLSVVVKLAVMIAVVSIIYAIVHAEVKLGKYILQFILYVIDYMLSGALVYTTLECVRGHKTTLGAAFSVVGKKWVSILVTAIFVGILTLISLILFIIPFFFVFPRLALALYYVIDQDMGPGQAVSASWEHTKGNVGKVYGIVGVTILIIIPSITIIGILLTLYLGVMYAAAYAILYVYINKQSGTSLATPAAPTIAPAPPTTPSLA